MSSEWKTQWTSDEQREAFLLACSQVGRDGATLVETVRFLPRFSLVPIPFKQLVDEWRQWLLSSDVEGAPV